MASIAFIFTGGASGLAGLGAGTVLGYPLKTFRRSLVASLFTASGTTLYLYCKNIKSSPGDFGPALERFVIMCFGFAFSFGLAISPLSRYMFHKGLIQARKNMTNSYNQTSKTFRKLW